MTRICQCGCGQPIEPKPHHKYQPPKYLPGHAQRAGIPQRSRKKVKRRIPRGGTLCACGCGTHIPEFFPGGTPRYAQSSDGAFYVKGHHRVLSGPDHPHWKGGRFITDSGYVRVYRPGHHLANNRGYALEHRLIWEEATGERLKPHEAVHHINGIRDDNRPENLVVLSHSDHAMIHDLGRRVRATREQLSANGRKGAEARWGKRH